MQMNNYRYKATTFQSIKIDKENENVQLKRRSTIPSKVKASATENKNARANGKVNEPVWERLSKVKKMPSSSDIGKSQVNVVVGNKTSQRIHTYSQVSTFTMQEEVRKPLTPSYETNTKRNTPGRKSQPTKSVVVPIIEPDVQSEAFMYLCQPNCVKELMTPRSLSDSKSSSDYKNDAEDTFRVLDKENSQISLIDDKLALCPEPNNELSSSRTIITNFRDLLRRKQNSTPSPEELDLLKNVIKSDERHTELNKNDSTLFKDILKTQLKSILRKGTIVKSALSKLEFGENFIASQLVQTDSPYETPLNSARSNVSSNEEPKKLEVDVVFKNVPSLEKEISLLRTLGEKLTATLNSKLSLPSFQVESDDSIPYPSQLEIAKSSSKNLLTIQSYIQAIEHNATIAVHSQYTLRKGGIVREFRIVQRTIVELKDEANKPFYIPSDLEYSELKRTSFRKLKQNPDVLMRHIKPKNTLVTFNILDQDPIFFNNIFFNKNMSKHSLCGEPQGKVSLTESCASEAPSCAIGDGCALVNNLSHELIGGVQSQLLVPKEIKSGLEQSNITADPTTTTNIASAPVSGDGLNKKDNLNTLLQNKRPRKRIRQNLTPMPAKESRIQPKNDLLKTIFVGVAQMSIFIFLIMAFTYPGPKC